MTVMGTVKQVPGPPKQSKYCASNFDEHDHGMQGVEGRSAVRGPKVDRIRSSESSPSNRNGSTPKRNKTRRSFNPVLTHPKEAIEIAPQEKRLSKDAVMLKRQPLRGLGLNTQDPDFWSPTQSPPQKFSNQSAQTPSASSKENSVYCLEADPGGNSFGSDVFTSTNYQRSTGSEGHVSNDQFEDTTVDF